MTEALTRQLEDFLGQFLDYDTNFRSGFCPVRIRVDPSKIVFRSDVTLRAAVRRRLPLVNRWLREADGSESLLLEKERESRGKIQDNLSDSRDFCRDDLVNLFPNPNLIPLGVGQSENNLVLTSWHNRAP
ncbi:hypothetical protein J1N35_006098 [Gossypium stocksii]|uniref:Uncharacterized protein n=1 Tax=Gossypium stocksii TaxID=47602 RepID=A0A9D3WFP2_9ROSI|nr:hypothetical protein J1N35_006098 [Gossypium stocksii]